MSRNLIIVITFFSWIILFSTWHYVQAGDFVLSPAKIEVLLNPGERVFRALFITNRLGETVAFKVEIEDFQGSADGEKAVVLSGSGKGPYSLKDYLQPEVSQFTLQDGQSMTLPLLIAVPEGMEPGGLYGAVLVSPVLTGEGAAQGEEEGIIAAEEPEKTEGEGQVRVVGRAGALFFVRVQGEVEEAGALEKFVIKGTKRFFWKGPTAFSIFFRNTGNVHLVPAGKIELSNIFKKPVAEIEIAPYFAMPTSLRRRDILLGKELSPGYYTATLFLNRGYQDIADKANISFWVVPPKVVAMVLVILLAVVVPVATLQIIGKRRRRLKKRKQEVL